MWLWRVKDIPIPSLNREMSISSPLELRRQTIQHVQVDSRWHHEGPQPRTVTKSPQIETRTLCDALLLPGGDFVAIVFLEGGVSLQLIGKKGDTFLRIELARLLPGPNGVLFVIRVTPASTPDHDLLLVIELGRWRVEFVIFTFVGPSNIDEYSGRYKSSE